MHASDAGIYDHAYLFEYNFAAIFLPAKEDHAEMKARVHNIYKGESIQLQVYPV